MWIPKDNKFNSFFYHHFMVFVGLLVGAGIVSAMPWYNSGLGWIYNVGTILHFVILALFIMSIGGMVGHNSGTCLTCINSVPSDAAMQVKEKDSQLRMSHWGARLQVLPIILLWIVGASWANTSDIGAIKWAGVIGMATWWIFNYYHHRSNRTHEILRSFCPYCKGGGGWDDNNVVVVPTPDPSGAKTR